jgi:hypothetical protein
MVFGDIHDLLRKVNGESEPAYMWQSDKQGKEVRTEEPPAVQEEQAREPDEKSDKESRQETSEKLLPLPNRKKCQRPGGRINLTRKSPTPLSRILSRRKSPNIPSLQG